MRCTPIYFVSFITLFFSVNFYAMINSDYDKEGDRPIDFIKPGACYKSKERPNILRFIPRNYEIKRLRREKQESKSKRCFIRKKYKENFDLSIYEEILDDIDFKEYKFIPILSSGETVNKFKERLDRQLDTDFSENSTKPDLLQVLKNFYLRGIEILRQEEAKEGTKKLNEIKAYRMKKIYLPTLLKCYEKDIHDRGDLFKIVKTESRRFNENLKKLRKKEKLRNETSKLLMTIGLLNQDRSIRKK